MIFSPRTTKAETLVRKLAANSAEAKQTIAKIEQRLSEARVKSFDDEGQELPEGLESVQRISQELTDAQMKYRATTAALDHATANLEAIRAQEDRQQRLKEVEGLERRLKERAELMERAERRLSEFNETWRKLVGLNSDLLAQIRNHPTWPKDEHVIAGLIGIETSLRITSIQLGVPMLNPKTHEPVDMTRLRATPGLAVAGQLLADVVPKRIRDSIK